MTLSFLWWLPIVKAPYVKKKVTCTVHFGTRFISDIFVIFLSFKFISIPYHTQTQ